MKTFAYPLPGFRGYSALSNKDATQAEDIQNFTVRETSLKPRNGSAVQVGATTAQLESLFLYRQKDSDKYFLGAEGKNLWVANTAFSDWITPALQTDCYNALFCAETILDEVYMGNGSDALCYDGTTLSDVTGSPPGFTYIRAWENRLYTNDINNPTYLRYSDIEDPAATLGDHYIQISENTGDAVKGFIPMQSCLFILNEYSAFALYSSSSPTKVSVGPVGTISPRSIANVNEVIYWLSHSGVCRYGGGKIYPISFDFGVFTDLVNTTYMNKAVGVAYKSCYWLAVPWGTSTTNNVVLIYDTLTEQWTRLVYPFSINDFCLDGETLYAAASDGKVYKLDYGTLDDTDQVTYSWTSDALDMKKPGMRKRVRNIAVELSEVAGGGILSLYLKEDDGLFSSPFTVDIPSGAPGKTVVVKVNTGRFYNLTAKLETTVKAEINKITFGGKYKPKVK